MHDHGPVVDFRVFTPVHILSLKFAIVPDTPQQPLAFLRQRLSNF